jgi:hypothetical protein
MDALRKSAKTWYQRDKDTPNPAATKLLHWIIDEVISHRRSRAFLLERSESSPLIDNLFDARVIHLLKRNVSAHDQPGVRYDVYKIDYGCYVDLLLTARSPQGLWHLIMETSWTYRLMITELSVEPFSILEISKVLARSEPRFSLTRSGNDPVNV